MTMRFEKLGPYRIGRQLGRGGMGAVYAAIDEESGQAAAVKVLSAILAQDEGFRARFESEIETLRKLRHPNIVRLIGFGENEGQLFYAMELVDGTSLEDQIRAGKRFDWRTVTAVGADVAKALRHAHDRGVVHRDIKPANILRTADGTTKLSDFGIARLFGSTRLTAVGGVIGTAEYMAPEQADGRPVTPRSDLYSLGGVLYALLAGRPPFEARTLPEMLQLQRFAQPEPVSRFAPDVPKELEQIVQELLAKEPETRIANAAILARRLEATALGLAKREEAGKTIAPSAEMADEASDFDVATAVSTAKPAPVELPETLAATEVAPATEQPEIFATQAPEPARPRPSQLAATSAAATKDVEAFSLAPAVELTPGAAGLTEARPASKTHAVSRFTAVAENEVEESQREEDEPSALISAQTWVLVAALVMLAVGIWYFLQPPSADSLYLRISEAANDGGPDSLLDVEDEVREFLNLYSHDPRAVELRDYQTQINLQQAERKLDRRARSGNRNETLSPIELAYIDAIRIAPADPQKAIVKLEALIAVYSDQNADNETVRQCLELAKRQLARLKGQAELGTAEQIASIRERLAHAQEVNESNPQLSRAICQGIVDLYGDKPWATSLVAQARSALGE
ncbi:MAG: protein kinase [Pirellulales bacterium]|nr:protein kinase [Pirellulales bacterium]